MSSTVWQSRQKILFLLYVYILLESFLFCDLFVVKNFCGKKTFRVFRVFRG
jgi:hypothetical protein